MSALFSSSSCTARPCPLAAAKKSGVVVPCGARKAAHWWAKTATDGLAETRRCVRRRLRRAGMGGRAGMRGVTAAERAQTDIMCRLFSRRRALTNAVALEAADAAARRGALAPTPRVR